MKYSYDQVKDALHKIDGVHLITNVGTDLKKPFTENMLRFAYIDQRVIIEDDLKTFLTKGFFRLFISEHMDIDYDDQDFFAMYCHSDLEFPIYLNISRNYNNECSIHHVKVLDSNSTKLAMNVHKASVNLVKAWESFKY